MNPGTLCLSGLPVADSTPQWPRARLSRRKAASGKRQASCALRLPLCALRLHLALLALGVLVAGCARNGEPPKDSASRQARFADPLVVALAPHEGTGKLDAEIRRFQEQVRAGRNPDLALERLGWLFVQKARASFDAGFYKLAEQCALALQSRRPDSPEALLLRGHVLHNLHRFKEAEPLARELVARRGLPFDFGLLGDVLMEQGNLAEAIAACQKMVDLRPDLHSYARGAHLRWLKGNLTGAEKLMRMAASAASPQDPESAAWVNTRLAGYEFQSGAIAEAQRTCAIALEFQNDYAPALLLRGRLLLAKGSNAEAAEVTRRAAELNPLPEYQWTLAEALRASGRADQAVAVETQLHQSGAVADPRTYSLYLATRGESVETALKLAEAELEVRGDVFTHDALAWALAASSKLAEAGLEIDRALSEGTSDGRLLFHAAVIAHKTGKQEDAQRWAEQAIDLKQMLLPSEREQLQVVAQRSEGGGQRSEARAWTPSDLRPPTSALRHNASQRLALLPGGTQTSFPPVDTVPVPNGNSQPKGKTP